MNEQDINGYHQEVIRLLKQKRIKEALNQLKTLLGEKGDWNLRNQLEQVSTSYDYMLQYMLQGSSDPQREKLYHRILQSAWEINDQARISLLDTVSNSYFHIWHKNHKNIATGYHIYDWLRVVESFADDLAVCELMPDNVQSLDKVLKHHEEADKNLFLMTWCNTSWSREDLLEAREVLVPDRVPSHDRCLFISAVTLSLLECFDPAKLSWLLTATTYHDDISSVIRASVGIALVLLKYPDRLDLYPEIQERLEKLATGNLGRYLNLIYKQLLCAQETEKINKHIKEDIMPEMIKKASEMKNKNIEDFMDDEDFNPDWEKALEESGLDEKIREMNELQNEGADVNMSSFEPLKNHLFFYELHNWFLPFDLRHSSLMQPLKKIFADPQNSLNMLLQSGMFCNSDKYSLCFLLTSFSESNRDVITSNFTNQGMEEALKDNKIQEHSKKPEVVCQQYIQDLYRFFKLHPNRKEFFDPFAQEINLHRIPALKSFLNKPDALKQTADYLFRKEHPLAALDIYLLLMDQQQADADTFQKAGFCYQKLKRYPEAIDAFQKADILKPDHIWTIRHLATSYRHLHQFEEALSYYQKAEAIEPENKQILFFTGSCLAELQRYDEAMKYFFKLDYLEEGNPKTWRALGWCSFMSHKTEQAEKYYQMLLDKAPSTPDYLNAGHIAWTQGQLEKAAECYGKALLKSGNKTDFLEMFEKDRQILLEKGIPAQDIPLMLDVVLEKSTH